MIGIEVNKETTTRKKGKYIELHLNNWPKNAGSKVDDIRF
jgi:hypothetical protein